MCLVLVVVCYRACWYVIGDVMRAHGSNVSICYSFARMTMQPLIPICLPSLPFADDVLHVRDLRNRHQNHPSYLSTGPSPSSSHIGLDEISLIRWSSGPRPDRQGPTTIPQERVERYGACSAEDVCRGFGSSSRVYGDDCHVGGD